MLRWKNNWKLPISPIQLSIQINSMFEKKIQGLKRNIQNLQLHLDDLELHQRSNCLILHRSDIANNENYNEFLKEVINILNIKLKLPSTDVIQTQDIDICPLPASFKQK